MKHLFSPRMRVGTWRQLWIWLLEAQKELGLPVTDEALSQMKAHRYIEEEEFEIAAKEEAKRRLVFSQCPNQWMLTNLYRYARA